MDVHHVEPVKKIFPKRPAFDIGQQIGVGGRDEADVDLGRPGIADAQELMLLQDAQQGLLHVLRQVADLIE
jgi:hypothetical protein